MSDYEVKYIRVRVSPWLSRAIKYSAAVYGIGTQKLTEGLLAQALLQVSPELKRDEYLATSCDMPGVPKIDQPHAPSTLTDEEMHFRLDRNRQMDKYHGLSPAARDAMAAYTETALTNPHLARAAKIRAENASHVPTPEPEEEWDRDA